MNKYWKAFGILGMDMIIGVCLGVYGGERLYKTGYHTGRGMAYKEVNEHLETSIKKINEAKNKETVEETTEG